MDCERLDHGGVVVGVDLRVDREAPRFDRLVFGARAVEVDEVGCGIYENSVVKKFVWSDGYGVH